MQHIYQTENVFEALHQNTPMVAECYGEKVKLFSYHDTATDWPQAIKWHRSRHPRPVFCFMEVREVSHPVIFDANQKKNWRWIPHTWVEHGVDPKHILWIGNHHSMIDHEDTVRTINLPIHTAWIRYFEAEAVFRHYHQTASMNRQGPFHQTIRTLMSHDKKYLALFGKPRKFMRAGAMVQMFRKGMTKQAIISSLAEQQGITECVEWASSYWPRTELERAFKNHQGSVDDIQYDFPNTDNSNYKGYPYDPKLYEDTAISIVAETNDIGVMNAETTGQFWVTEKICRPMFNYHPFVVLSTPNFLKNLRSLGYKTFGTIVDESYDQEQDPYARLDKALDCAIELANAITSTHMKSIVVNNFEMLRKVYSDTNNMIKDKLNFISSLK